MLAPMPSDETVAGLYPPVYSFRPDFETQNRLKQIMASLEEKTFYRLIHNQEVKRISRHTGVASGTMLDVGCGTGGRLSRFARAGFAVRGMEIQPELVDYVRERLGFDADAGTLDTISYEDDSFDIVTIYWVIEHLLDVGSVLDKIYAMLKPGGWMVAGVPLADSAQSRMLGRRWTQYCEAPRHVAIPSQKGIQKATRASGFDEVKIVPANVLDCASYFSLSLIPSAATSFSYSGSGFATHMPRLAAGLLAVLYSPVATVENYLLKLPAGSLVLARKPPAA